MFLLPAGRITDAEACDMVRKLLERYGADIKVMDRWDERKLAYEIAKQKRGLYILAFCEMDPQKVIEIERDSNLNEEILRLLVLSREGLTAEDAQVEFDVSSKASQECPEIGNASPYDDDRGYQRKFSRNNDYNSQNKSSSKDVAETKTATETTTEATKEETAE